MLRQSRESNKAVLTNGTPMTPAKPLTSAGAAKALRAAINAKIGRLICKLVDTPPGSRRELFAKIRDLERLRDKIPGRLWATARKLLGEIAFSAQWAVDLWVQQQ